MITAAISVVLVGIGAFFFLAGTLGLLRFPDPLSRLHALSKADNAGLGFIVVGLLVRAPSVAEAVQLLAVWALGLIAGGIGAQIIAGAWLRGER